MINYIDRHKQYLTLHGEVFAYDWIFVFKNKDTKEKTVIHNNGSALREMLLTDDVIFCGFNNKHYDNHVAKVAATGGTVQEIKELNDFLIKGGHGWEHPYTKRESLWFDTFDIKDDMQQGLSLKSIEGHLYMPIVESSMVSRFYGFNRIVTVCNHF